MTGRDHVLAQVRWRAPKDDGAALIDPPLASAANMLATNRELLQSYRADLLGRSLPALASQARRELLALARAYTGVYRDLPVADDSSPLLLAGHQPELFHAGVWFKNFVLSSLATRLNALAVNLLIDNDTLRTAAIRVPTGTLDNPRIELIPFDAPSDEVPFEDREILDAACFHSFASRSTAAIAPLVANPLLTDLWPLAKSDAGRSRNLGRAIAEARHRLEGSLGLATLELPLSQVCETDSFRWFTTGLLAGLPRLHEVYNRSLAEYRRANKLRSRSHPVPNLVVEQGFLEAPFWLWTREDPRRGRMFVFRHADRLEVTDRDRMRFELPLSGERAVDALRKQSEAGVRVRPRALVTTMFARLLLADLFVHGIGGGKYDQLTDAIMARFFGITPPAFLTATATVRLPVERPMATVGDLLRLAKEERELRFHPERFLFDQAGKTSGEVQRLIAEKEHWLAGETVAGEARDRHQGIERANLAMQPFLESQRLRLARERESVAPRLRSATLLGSREFAYCLFPREFVVPVLEQLSK